MGFPGGLHHLIDVRAVLAGTAYRRQHSSCQTYIIYIMHICPRCNIPAVILIAYL